MIKTFKISLSLKNAYLVNAILFSLKQVPLLKKLLPAKLYQNKTLKIFANIFSITKEIVSTFVGKFLNIFIILNLINYLYINHLKDKIFVHILLFLSVIGALLNSNIFSLTKDKYYALFLLRMDAKKYTLSNYIYYILKIIIGFMPFTILYQKDTNLPLWFCIILPFCIAGIKLIVAAFSLYNYEKNNKKHNKNLYSKFFWFFIGILLIAAFILPLFNIVVAKNISITIFLLCFLLGIISFFKVASFKNYLEINKELLQNKLYIMDENITTKTLKENTENNISKDKSIKSEKQGFEYLNELFIKRHKKILWNSVKITSYTFIFIIFAIIALLFFKVEYKPKINQIIKNILPFFTFIMYVINKGSNFTQALFMNCDHSLLTYSFYKKPKFILKLFQIRLREIIKINLLPAIVIGIGILLILYMTGGGDNLFDYVVIFTSIICMSIFFSIHYLTIYYLLQPYNAQTELKSVTYSIVTSTTYLMCYLLTKKPMPIMSFGIFAILFCIIYIIIASILVYIFAPKTFKIRN